MREADKNKQSKDKENHPMSNVQKAIVTASVISKEGEEIAVVTTTDYLAPHQGIEEIDTNGAFDQACQKIREYYVANGFAKEGVIVLASEEQEDGSHLVYIESEWESAPVMYIELMAEIAEPCHRTAVIQALWEANDKKNLPSAVHAFNTYEQDRGLHSLHFGKKGDLVITFSYIYGIPEGVDHIMVPALSRAFDILDSYK
jgi:hypothetical protein